MARARHLIGSPTRGTTNPNRLRRVDRWLTTDLAVSRALSGVRDPLVVDLGYGAAPVTTIEMARRLAAVRPSVRVLGLELDQERVDAAATAADPPRLDFARGGFELAGTRPVLVRAFNVLRQYAEADVVPSWSAMLASVKPGGLLVDGTCDELGRVGSWVTVSHEGPRTLTISVHLGSLDRPSTVAERLPKALIHRNVEGERVHDFLRAMDSCWAASAPFASYGRRARWTEMVLMLAARGWPVLGRRERWRLGELTVPWECVQPTERG
ncbi:methylase [Prauserella marina]|uniref:Uncharacterized protein n=1 Tax=Prauserella marina TaxID=530584 RepID=A0A222VJJ6_9PSEU|nr:SAM-dependent methyltransferase [Prauserella marina]ASR33943.1 methylase [Prauserella marina]PWV82545.1 hypothetical protein DES30_102788 [Prauserella marina]SDC71684.1 hypothetical protein SAMN05421630_103324 [Prauserella marina]